MKYIVGWIDATLQEHFKDVDDLRETYKLDGLTVDEVEECNDGWYDLSVSHAFEADSNDQAVAYINKFFDGYGRDIGAGTGVFTLRGLENDFYYTEEDMYEPITA